MADSDQILRRNDLAYTGYPARDDDRTARRAPVIVLEVRHGELMESITQQAAERGIPYGASFARAYVIPSEYHVAIPDNEQIVFAKAPEAPADQGRITDTRVSLP